MNSRDMRDQFLRIADSWICQDSNLDIRFIALKIDADWVVSGASVSVGPVPYKVDNSFQVRTSLLTAGCVQIPSSSKAVAMQTLSAALEGKLEICKDVFALAALNTISWYSDAPTGETWYSPLHLRVNTTSNDPPRHSHVVASIDDELRRCAIPFDGLADLGAFLGVRSSVGGSRSPSIEITVSPPLDVVLDECTLSNDRFVGVLRAHEHVNVESVQFAIRAVPGMGMQARRQIASQIIWTMQADGYRRGSVNLELPQSDSVLTMLSYGGRTIRRNWFVDPRKAPNHRYVSMIQTDPDLRMLRRAVFDDPESRKMERAIAALLHMLGFSAALPAEQDSADIIGSTPGGSTIIVECTSRIADVHAKLGKLVERRAALSKALEAANLPTNVVAALACRLASDEISLTKQEAASRGILLFSREDIEAGFRRIRFVQNPDALLQEWVGVSSGGGING